MTTTKKLLFASFLLDVDAEVVKQFPSPSTGSDLQRLMKPALVTRPFLSNRLEIETETDCFYVTLCKGF